MRKPKKEIQLTSYDELLGINEAEQNTLNQIVEVPLNELHPFRNHPFHVNDDEKMAETVESIKNYGILNPALVRPRAEGGYELIAGHRRKRGCELAGKSKMPVLIRNYTDDEQQQLDEIVALIVETISIERENITISGVKYPYQFVKSRLLLLEESHIEYVLDCLHENTREVKNIVCYYFRYR